RPVAVKNAAGPCHPGRIGRESAGDVAHAADTAAATGRKKSPGATAGARGEIGDARRRDQLFFSSVFSPAFTVQQSPVLAAALLAVFSAQHFSAHFSAHFAASATLPSHLPEAGQVAGAASFLTVQQAEPSAAPAKEIEAKTEERTRMRRRFILGFVGLLGDQVEQPERRVR